jgi:PAS domain S-box-containing protein
MNQPASILIIDDDRGTCETVGDVLRAKGYAVETATRGREGLDKLSARPFDAGIVDIKLPDISGLDLLEALKGASPETEVVFITGFASLATAIQAINGAAYAYITKPFEMDHLLATLDRALEKQRLARAVRDSEERYRLIHENINDAIFLADLEGRLIFSNRRGEELAGYRQEEFVGRPLLSLLTPEGARLAQFRLGGGAGGPLLPFFECEIIRKEGSRIWVEANVTNVVKDGRVVGRLGVMRDITERRQAEQELHLQSTALESAANAILITDREGAIIWINSAFTSLTGYVAEEAIGQTPRILKSGRQDPSFYQDLWRTILAGQVWHGEIVNRRKDGSLYTEEQIITPVRDERGEISHFVGIKQDITERKRLQEQLIQSEKLGTLGQLIAGIAHELNNPLAAMVGHAQMLRLGQQDPKVAARAEKIVDAALRATRIVRNFLTVARQHRPERIAVSVNDTVTKTLELLAYQLRVSNIEVESALAPDLPQIAGDPHQLQQVILNLVLNAIQAMAAARGQGKLKVASDLSPDRSTIRLAVTDNGPGIPPEHLPRVLEPFFTTKPQGEGTGLGLAIAQGIVTDHGGIIAVESTPGQGATFSVTLPVTAPPVAKPAAPPAKAFPKDLRVLVVDDEAGLREMMAEALAGQGARVETAPGGREALEILARVPVDVLVLDVRMPEVSGTDLWSQVSQANPALARRTVFCTGDVIGAETHALIAATGCPSVSKPFEWARFFEAVAEAASR